MTYFPHPSPKALDFFNMLGSLPTWSPHSFRPVTAPPRPPHPRAPQQLVQNISVKPSSTCSSHAGFGSKQQIEGAVHICSKAGGGSQFQ